MMRGQDLYLTLDRALRSTIVGAAGFPEYVQTAPVSLRDDIFRHRQARLAIIRAFFDVTLQVFGDAVAGKCSPTLTKLLFNDAPTSYGVEFHRVLPQEV